MDTQNTLSCSGLEGLPEMACELVQAVNILSPATEQLLTFFSTIALLVCVLYLFLEIFSVRSLRRRARRSTLSSYLELQIQVQQIQQESLDMRLDILKERGQISLSQENRIVSEENKRLKALVLGENPLKEIEIFEKGSKKLFKKIKNLLP